jgi:hypothetical protein
VESTEVKEMKKLAIFLIAPILVACSSTSNTTPSKTAVSINIPISCPDSKVLAAVSSEINGAEFIDTKWTPAPETELADFLSNGGIACSFGISNAEIGATVRWVKDDKNNFEKWIPSWVKDGYEKVNLSEFGITEGYFLQKAQSDTQEFNIWILNFKTGGVWVSIGRTSGSSINDGKKLIDAVITQ